MKKDLMTEELPLTLREFEAMVNVFFADALDVSASITIINDEMLYELRARHKDLEPMSRYEVTGADPEAVVAEMRQKLLSVDVVAYLDMVKDARIFAKKI